MSSKAKEKSNILQNNWTTFFLWNSNQQLNLEQLLNRVKFKLIFSRVSMSSENCIELGLSQKFFDVDLIPKTILSIKLKLKSQTLKKHCKHNTIFQNILLLKSEKNCKMFTMKSLKRIRPGIPENSRLKKRFFKRFHLKF